MKKLILLIFIVFITISCKPGFDKDPLKYKGCVIVEKMEFINGRGIRIKLTHSMRDSLRRDYDWISVPKWEWDKFDVGDTIK